MGARRVYSLMFVIQQWLGLETLSLGNTRIRGFAHLQRSGPPPSITLNTEHQ